MDEPRPFKAHVSLTRIGGLILDEMCRIRGMRRSDAIEEAVRQRAKAFGVTEESFEDA